MTLHAQLHATLADIKRGGCCGLAYDSCTFFGTTGGVEFPPLYRGRFLESLATRYVVHSSRVCHSGRARQRNVDGYPKHLKVKWYETNVASLITKCLTRPVI